MGKADDPSNLSTRDSFTTGNGRRPSVLSRSSSLTDTRKKTDWKKKKVPCMWNLDFSPYNSPLIRIKYDNQNKFFISFSINFRCFYRYLSVYGVSIDPGTKIKEVNYSCF